MASQDKVYEDVNKIKKNVQGGKAFGAAISTFEKELDQIGADYLAGNSEATQADIDNYKRKFLIYDEDRSGDISIDELKRMMEKLGKAVTHKEAVHMISQVDTVGKGTIFYKCVSLFFCSFRPFFSQKSAKNWDRRLTLCRPLASFSFQGLPRNDVGPV